MKSMSPVRTARQNPLLATVAIIIVILGCVTVVLLVNQSSAVRALRTSSSRSECRTKITNEAEDLNRHDNAQLFVYVSELIKRANANDLVASQDSLDRLHALAQTMKDRPSVQDSIDRRCPRPLVATRSTSGG